MIQKIKAVIFSKRMQSLYWRTGMMALAFFIDGVAENLMLLDLSPEMVVMLGLILGEISKMLNPKAKS